MGSDSSNSATFTFVFRLSGGNSSEGNFGIAGFTQINIKKKEKKLACKRNTGFLLYVDARPYKLTALITTVEKKFIVFE